MLKIEPAAQRRMLESLARWRRLLQVTVDFAAWTVAGLAAIAIRYEFDVTWSLLADGLLFGVIAGTTHVIVGRLAGLYVRRWHYGSIGEMPARATTTGVTVLTMASGNALLFDRAVPFSVPVLAAGIAIALMGASRLSWRLLLGRSLRPSHERLGRTVIFGAGTAGSQLAEQLLSDPNSPLLPVAFLDDDPAKARLRLFGVPVLGTRDRLAAVAEQVDADTIVVAVPSAGSDLMRELSELALGTGLDVRVLPLIAELLDGIRVGDVRELSEEDLLGRHVVERPTPPRPSAERLCQGPRDVPFAVARVTSVGRALVAAPRTYSLHCQAARCSDLMWRRIRVRGYSAGVSDKSEQRECLNAESGEDRVWAGCWSTGVSRNGRL